MALSDRERDVTRFLSELDRRVKETQALEQSLREKLIAQERNEKEIGREWERRETVKLKNWRPHRRSAPAF